MESFLVDGGRTSRGKLPKVIYKMSNAKGTAAIRRHGRSRSLSLA